MKRKLVKLLCTACMFSMLTGTVVMAKSYDFYLQAGISKQTDTIAKTAKGSAYVDRTGPAGATTVLTVNMCNSAGAQKSEKKAINGIGHVYLSYSGYGVDVGDYIALMGTNEVSRNGGKSISANGTFTP